MPNLLCMVATPTRELFSGEIAYADVPGSEGNYGVLSGHEMLVAKNSPGVLTLWMDAAGNEKRRFALYEGATQVYADRLTVLARFGVDVDNIDAEAVRKKADGMRERRTCQIVRPPHHKGTNRGGGQPSCPLLSCSAPLWGIPRPMRRRDSQPRWRRGAPRGS